MSDKDLPAEFLNFDILPASARVPLRVVGLSEGCSDATVWRLVKADLLPKPHKISNGMTRWSVAELRAYRAARVDMPVRTYAPRGAGRKAKPKAAPAPTGAGWGSPAAKVEAV